MRRFDPSRSILAGMDPVTLQTQLTNLQLAYIALSSGAKGESYSYTQGDGGKTVTFTRANLAALTQAIQLLQAQLGNIPHPRRAFSVMFSSRP